ncbi:MULTISPECIES: ParB N-terminal domain-containing protein [unclassified Ruegeria]|uniref:ParB/RepB/Spo0J family partition protein n=1 Tax=unclassified Ruegeria TaxID=2625375 RepID=UPI0014879C14|nr:MULTISPECIES: ParB N-terminal domain-containing protein [unclassified Ruegeria]
MSRNKFGFSPINENDLKKTRRRDVGPMGAAVRETANSLSESTEDRVEQRRKNASEAKEYRKAQDEGRVLAVIGLDAIHTSDLPRDRLDLSSVASSDEMDELKASIQERGQKEPIEVYKDPEGRFQLKKGWRRLTALSQLFEETGDERFASVTARVDNSRVDRIDLYVDMVEENVVREDLTFAEMAQVAILAARDAELGAGDADALVGRLYASLHKMKRSYIRSFVFLLGALEEALPYPKAISRNLGVEVARKLRATGTSEALKERLARVNTAEEQNEVLAAFAAEPAEKPAEGRAKEKSESVKYEFHVGSSKITARKGECRILSRLDFSSIDRSKLQKAVEAFEAILREE